MKKLCLIIIAVALGFSSLLNAEESEPSWNCISGNCENGEGTATRSDGAQYIGQWKDGKRHGQGTFTYADGRKYVGEWKNGKKDGQGTLTFVEGDKYIGQFKDDNYYGQGTYTFADGRN